MPGPLIMRTLRSFGAIGLLSVILAVGLLIGALTPGVLKGPIALLFAQDEPSKADLIVVLAGSRIPRALWARDLYARNLSHKILLSPVPPDPWRDELDKLGLKGSPYSISQQILIASGVPLSAIDQLDTYGESTITESRLVSAYAAHHGVQSVLLVTSPLGSRRQCWIFRRALPSVSVSCQPSPYDHVKYDRKLILQVIDECLKFLANAVGISN